LDHLTLSGCRLGPTFDAFLGSARVRKLDLEEILHEMDVGEEAARLSQLATNPHVKDLGFDVVVRDVFPLLGPGLETLRLRCADDIDDASLCEYIAARGQGLTSFAINEPLSLTALAAFPRTLRHLNTIVDGDSDEAWIQLGELVNLETLTVYQGSTRKPPSVQYLHRLTRLRKLSLDTVRIKTAQLRALCDSLPALESLRVSWPTANFKEQEWFAKFTTWNLKNFS
jgi:hypothetical protein